MLWKISSPQCIREMPHSRVRIYVCGCVTRGAASRLRLSGAAAAPGCCAGTHLARARAASQSISARRRRRRCCCCQARRRGRQRAQSLRRERQFFSSARNHAVENIFPFFATEKKGCIFAGTGGARASCVPLSY